METTYGQAPLAILFGAQANGRRDSHGHADDQADQAVHDADEHEHEEMVETRSFTRREPIHEADLRALVSGLPAGVLRAKGFVYLAEDPERRYQLQLVGKRWTLTAGAAWDQVEPGTRVVFIGLPGSLEVPALEASWIVR